MKPLKKLSKNALDFTKLGIVQGVGIQAVGKVGGDTSALSTMSSYNPVLGNIAGASATLDAVKGLSKKSRRR